MDLTAHTIERHLLGALLRWPHIIADVQQMLCVDDLSPDHAHRVIYATLVRMADEGKPIEAASVGADLAARGQIESIGGYGILGELLDVTPTGGNALHYAGLVRERSMLRRLASIGLRIAERGERPTGPAAAMVEESERELFALCQGSLSDTTFPLPPVLCKALERIDARIGQRESGAEATSLPTGFIDLDRLTSGLHNGTLTILAARPSQGKTSLGLCLYRNCLLEARAPALFVSLEQSRDELAERLLSVEASVNGQRIQQGTLTPEEGRRLVSARACFDGRGFIDDASTQTVTRIAANARRLKLRHGIRLVIIDYLQLIDPEDRKQVREQQVAQMTRRLKQLARDLAIPVVVLAQLNREVEHRNDGKPRLADLRESGSQEQDADLVLLLHPSKEEPGRTDVIVAKHRNGPTGACALTYLKEFTRFENYARAN